MLRQTLSTSKRSNTLSLSIRNRQEDEMIYFEEQDAIVFDESLVNMLKER